LDPNAAARASLSERISVRRKATAGEKTGSGDGDFVGEEKITADASLNKPPWRGLNRPASTGEEKLPLPQR